MSTPLTYLQLCQDVRIEVMANGAGPATVVGQTGEYQRIAKSVADADEEIQQKHDNWRFMVADFQILTTAGVAAYLPGAAVSPITDLRTWKHRTIKCYLDSRGKADERFLTYIDLEAWDALYNTGTQTNNPPQHWTIGDDMALLIGPVPDGVYRVTGKYMRAAQRLVADGDTPRYPAEFHRLAAYLGMMKYGRQTGASEVFQDAQRLYGQMLSRMERTQLAPLNQFRPLV